MTLVEPDELTIVAPADFTRSVDFVVLETRDDPQDDGLTFEGYAATFDNPTRIDSQEGRFDETVKRGAFKKTLRERTPVLMFDHGHHPLIGTMPIGAIVKASEDSRGVFIRARLHDNFLVQPVRDAIRSQAVHGMSFRFSVVRDSWTKATRGGVPKRDLLELRVPELGPVVFPAYEGTSASVRSACQAMLSDDAFRTALMASLPKREQIAVLGERATDDPGTIAQAICMTLDEAVDEFEAGAVDAGVALVNAANIQSAALLEALGVPDIMDADDMAEMEAADAAAPMGKKKKMPAKPPMKPMMGMNSADLEGDTREEIGTPTAAAPPSTVDGAATAEPPDETTVRTKQERRALWQRELLQGVFQ